MANLRMGVKILMTQHFDIHWENRVHLIYASKMRCLKEMDMARLSSGHL